jgi:hypothetical protein
VCVCVCVFFYKKKQIQIIDFSKFIQTSSDCILFYFFLRWFHYVTQAGLELVILLPQPPEC